VSHSVRQTEEETETARTTKATKHTKPEEQAVSSLGGLCGLCGSVPFCLPFPIFSNVHSIQSEAVSVLDRCVAQGRSPVPRKQHAHQFTNHRAPGAIIGRRLTQSPGWRGRRGLLARPSTRTPRRMGPSSAPTWGVFSRSSTFRTASSWSSISCECLRLHTDLQSIDIRIAELQKFHLAVDCAFGIGFSSFDVGRWPTRRRVGHRLGNAEWFVRGVSYGLRFYYREF